ncbi:hypothetical protein G9A89_013029 [Geosiphon pyriformis]|nr:hypothetical protein G9A89_013029 [Geosiphon pyriformis]
MSKTNPKKIETDLPNNISISEKPSFRLVSEPLVSREVLRTPSSPRQSPNSTKLVLSEHPSYPPSFHENEAARAVRIHSTFAGLDKNGTGFLDRDKIQKGLSEHKFPARNKYASELLQRCDTSKDGVVDFDEFKAFVEEKEKELWKLFLEIDKSRDMHLQPEELEGAFRKAGIQCTKEEIKKFIDIMDQDGNGIIDFGEWRDFLLLLPSETNLQEIYNFYQSGAQVNIDGEVVISPTDPKYFLAGAIAGAVSRTATAPFDRLKIYLQTQTVSPRKLNVFVKRGKKLNELNEIPSIPPGWKKATTAIKELYQKGGILNFFRGNGLNVAKIVPESSIKFYAYEQSKAIIAYSMGTEDIESIGISGRFLAGGIAGLMSQFIIYPLETLKTRLMSSAGMGSPSLKGSLLLRTAKDMWNIQGTRTFYKGLTPAMIGVFPYAAIDMSIYESLKMAYRKWEEKRDTVKKSNQFSALLSLGCGTTSGSIGATIVYPLSLVRTRLQAQGTPGHPQTYANALDVIKTTYSNEGIRGFYKGLAPTLIKVVPAAAITYLVYDQTKHKMKLS